MLTNFTIKPLGGLGQVGANTISVKHGDEHILIDAGILFPSEDLFDINYLIPDYTSLVEDPPSKIFITHGHEDHIGAISHIVKLFPEIEIFAPPFAARLIRHRLDNDSLAGRIITYSHNNKIDLGSFYLIPIALTHSIPETHGFFIGDHKNEVAIFYASDFKSDHDPLFEEKNNYNLLSAYAKKFHIRLLMADSTNIQKEGRSSSDREIVPNFETLFAHKNERIFITLFSSNVHRLQLIFDQAKKHKRKIYPIGRSIINMISMSKELGYLNDYNLTLPERSPGVKSESLIVLLSGPQGDFKGALRRVAQGEEGTFKPRPGDLFIMSSRAIPGNEKKVSGIINMLTEKGVEVITPSEMKVHTTGHASQEDLKDLYQAFAPTHAIPVHGESLHLKKHIHFIEKFFPDVKGNLIFNFDIATINMDGVHLQKGEALHPICIHNHGYEIERTTLSERRKVAQNGAVFVSLNTLSKPKSLNFSVHFIGLPTIAETYKENIEHLIRHHMRDIKKDEEEGKEILRIAIRRLFNEFMGIKPTTIIHIV